ncbi:CMP-N-acetylneuraminate-beta-galactosamide-alpha-2,3-sialyltransferase 1-like [Myxocyprinus asiaticus]|uniref:CMP-N-acetylneuraminate-beta-galactosamide- alpha-2,3-sialyltransferase 1-like n=1 Tax=Myxocyprinus asiaticus TaxID=70543 RepID=UPI002223A9FC|nr:CMP-N-acetylneuraminate-beta-galactosamide-alpha-2,3-sialyltransferase 1-like [Myxocyprinus asiaticus]
MVCFATRRGRYITLTVSVIIVLFIISQSTIRQLIFGACACGQCVMDLTRDTWFRQRFNPRVQPLLTPKNSVLSDSLYRWWQKLQYKSNVNYTAVVEMLFGIFPNEEYYLDAGWGRCRSCAVVGNSGNLKNSHYGPLIDAHDLVIRVNKGPTEGFERDVGSKTTHRIIYPESAVDMDNSTHLVLIPFKTVDLQWIISVFTSKHIHRTYVPVKPSIKANREKVMILHPAFLKYVQERWLQKHGRYPSTGFISLIFSLHICDQVNVFGFGADVNGYWHHYFEENKHPLNSGNHGGSFEYSITVKLHEKKALRLYKGW